MIHKRGSNANGEEYIICDEEDIAENLAPFGHSYFQLDWKDIKLLQEGKRLLIPGSESIEICFWGF